MAKIRNPLHYEIIPSPGTDAKDWDTLREKIEILKPFARAIHIDLLDGKFAGNSTFMDPNPFKEYSKDITLEAHFMTENPLQYLKPFANAGFTRFIGQIEMMSDVAEFVAEAQLLGEVGLAIDTPTSCEKLVPMVSDIDFAFVMTVKAGFSRQAFMPEMLEKVRKLREIEPLLPVEIDGGVNDKTILQAKNAGATRFVSTGFILGNQDDGQVDSASRFHILQDLLKS